MVEAIRVRAPGRVAGRLLVLAPLVVALWSAIAPVDRGMWFMEVAWIAVGLPLILAVWRRFPLTWLLCCLLLLHGVVLLYGGHYTYSETPLGNWVQDVFGLSRNPYDRLGHFVQGLVPAILVRELLVRLSPLSPGKLLSLLTTCVCLAFSAFFEFIEWWVALAIGDGADAVLNTQGDVFDTQWDMFLCLCGAIASLALLSRWHDCALGRRSESVETRETSSRVQSVPRS